MSNRRWRVIDTGPAGASFNMALDEAITRLTIRDDTAPTLRVYMWDRPSVTLGRFQRASDLDMDFCASMDIPIVRRPTGGRAILHGDELTYSFSANTRGGSFAGGLFKSYSILSDAFLKAFLSLGLDAKTNGRRKGMPVDKNPLCFSSTSYGEITIMGRKIIGSAQRRWPGGMLQQGSIPLAVSRLETGSVFLKTANKSGSFTGLREADTAITYGGLKGAIVSGFREALGVALEEDTPSEEELELAARLEEDKYQRPEWNLLR